jgi:hypothetical protein
VASPESGRNRAGVTIPQRQVRSGAVTIPEILRLAPNLQVYQSSPVILATGYSQEIAQSGSGGRPVILKPYGLAILSQALSDAMAGPGRNG